MGAELDRLEVQVEAQATKANNQLDKLVAKLDRVSSSLSHLNSGGLTGLSNGVAKFAQASTQLSNVKTTDFTRLTKNIQSLASLNTQQIYGAASAMRTLSTAVNSLSGVSASSMQVAQVAKDISKLGGANVQKAIANLPALAIAMNDLMVTLSKAPAVSSNVIQLTQSLANLASQGAKVGSASASIAGSVNSMGSAMSATTVKARGFSAIIGSFYQKYFLLLRGVGKLWDSIESSMGYVETLNYFDAAFGQVAENAVLQWQDAGYDAADAYYESFSSRAKELTSKMTGFNINDDGSLTASGAASLGINPSKLMNYQATFAQMSSSMGVASETSIKLSQALTEIGADLASVKNMDFDKVWTDMASGLAGMSRTLDKYGANIRNVNLQQKLFDLGINENITNLNQNDKALLRAIILLDSTKYAWGDLADTLNYPANQMRLLESNISNLSRTLGNLFLPALSNILPYVNGFVIAIQRLLTWVGNLMGIDLCDVIPSIGSSEIDMSELLGDTEDLSGNLDDASASAKKLKSNLLGIDELNVLSPQEESSTVGTNAGLSSGLLDAAFDEAFSEYQKVWDEAFANMENRANDFADKVEGYLQPVKDIISDFAIGDFFKAGEDTSNLVVGINNFLARAIDNVDWHGIGQKIGNFLAGVDWTAVLSSFGDLLWKGIQGAIELWEGSFDAAPVETAIISSLALLKFTSLGSFLGDKIIKAIAKHINFSSVGSVLLAGIEGLFGNNAAVSALAFMDKVAVVFTGISSVVGGAILAVTNFVAMLKDGFSWLNEILMVVGTALAAVGAVILGVSAPIAALVAAVVAAVGTIVVVVKDNWGAICEWFSGVGEWFNSNVIIPVVGFFKGLWEKVSGFFVNLWNDIVSIWSTVSAWYSEYVIEPVVSFFVGFYTRVHQIFEGLWIIVQAIWIKVSDWFNDVVIIPVVSFFQGLWESVSRFFSQLWEDVKGIWGIVSEWFNTSVVIPVTGFFEGLWINVSGFFSNLWEDIKSVWEKVSSWFDTNVVQPIEKVFNGLWSGIKSTMTSAMNAIIGGIESGINFIINGVNDIISGFNQVVSWAAEVAGEDWGGVELIPTVSLPRISWYEMGGFLPSRFSLVGAGENGVPEILGSVGGKPAIAGGEEITGIREEIRATADEEIALLREQNSLLMRLLEKELAVNIGDRDIYRANLRGAKSAGYRLITES